MDIQKFHAIKEKYGSFASWAVWGQEINKPKENVGDLSVFENIETSSLLSELKPNFILVALNPSRELVALNPSREGELVKFANFHSHSPNAQDYKLRFAVRGTPLWGAYITDAIKDYPELNSNNVKQHLSDNPECERRNIEALLNEVEDVCATNPIFFALGQAVHGILKRHLAEYHRVIKITHYSHRISKEKYRQEIVGMLLREGIAQNCSVYPHQF
jgi:hypothetical protein